MNRQMIAKELLKVARMVAEQDEAEKEKELFFERLLKEIKGIRFTYSFEEGTSGISIAASDKKEKKEHRQKYPQPPKPLPEPTKGEKLDETYRSINLTKKTWLNEITHNKPFYPRDFVRDVLESNMPIQEVKKYDKKKIDPRRYGFDGVEDTRKFLVDRIGRNNERTGLRFKPNSMKAVNSEGGIFDEKSEKYPIDLYTTILKVKETGNLERAYVKFFVDEKKIADFQFTFNFTYISLHPDKNQDGVDEEQEESSSDSDSSSSESSEKK